MKIRVLIKKLGILFEGEMKNHNRNGYGKLTYNDGSVYTGQWKDDDKHGKQRVFEMTEILGYGKMALANGDIFEGEFEYGNKKHGKYTWKNGDTFIGSCSKTNYVHGVGIYTVNGVSRNAEFQDGEFLKYVD